MLGKLRVDKAILADLQAREVEQGNHLGRQMMGQEIPDERGLAEHRLEEVVVGIRESGHALRRGSEPVRTGRK